MADEVYNFLDGGSLDIAWFGLGTLTGSGAVLADHALDIEYLEEAENKYKEILAGSVVAPFAIDGFDQMYSSVGDMADIYVPDMVGLNEYPEYGAGTALGATLTESLLNLRE